MSHHQPWVSTQKDQSNPEPLPPLPGNWRDPATAELSVESWESSRTRRDCPEALKRYSSQRRKRGPKATSTRILYSSSQRKSSSALQLRPQSSMVKLRHLKPVPPNQQSAAAQKLNKIPSIMNLKIKAPKITRVSSKINQIWTKKQKLQRTWETEYWDFIQRAKWLRNLPSSQKKLKQSQRTLQTQAAHKAATQPTSSIISQTITIITIKITMLHIAPLRTLLRTSI